jgi:hypothetical protein
MRGYGYKTLMERKRLWLQAYWKVCNSSGKESYSGWWLNSTQYEELCWLKTILTKHLANTAESSGRRTCLQTAFRQASFKTEQHGELKNCKPGNSGNVGQCPGERPSPEMDVKKEKSWGKLRTPGKNSGSNERCRAWQPHYTVWEQLHCLRIVSQTKHLDSAGRAQVTRHPQTASD